jgi:hypothetical protein
MPEASAEGMIVTHGGLVGGYGLYVRDGKQTFVYNRYARPLHAAKVATAQLGENHMHLHIFMHRATCAWAMILGLVVLLMAGSTSAQPVDIPVELAT